MREAWIDRWKGLLILCVVVGHIVGGGAHLATGETQELFEGVYRIIYLFHMPAFFVLAGYCWHSQTGSLASFALKKVKRLLIPYVVFGVASVIAYLALQKMFLSQAGIGVAGHYNSMGGEIWWQPFVSLLHAGGWPHGEGFRANSVLWFLPCLFTVEMIYATMDRFLPERRVQMLLSVLVLLAGFGMRRYVAVELPWGLGLAAWYLPFLILGRWMIRPLIERLQLVRDRFHGGALFVLTLCSALFVVCGWFTPTQYMMSVRFDWYLLFSGMALIGVVLSAIWAQVMGIGGPGYLGASSLTIMLVHKFPVLFFQTKIDVVRKLFIGDITEGVIGVVLVAVLALTLCELVNYVLIRWLPWMIGQRVIKRDS